VPDLSTYGEYPTPTGPEAADVPADFLALVTALDSHTVLFADSVADRNSRYSTIEAGAFVTCPSLATVWLALGSGTWETLYTNTGWLTTGFTWESTFANVSSRIRKVGNSVHVNIVATYSGSDITAPANGNITDVPVVTIALYRPVTIGLPTVARTTTAFGCAILSTAGVVTLTNLTPTAVLTTGQVFYASFSYLTD
jgi:hypothetical protein